jgi:hypothetical protein
VGRLPEVGNTSLVRRSLPCGARAFDARLRASSPRSASESGLVREFTTSRATATALNERGVGVLAGDAEPFGCRFVTRICYHLRSLDTQADDVGPLEVRERLGRTFQAELELRGVHALRRDGRSRTRGACRRPSAEERSVERGDRGMTPNAVETKALTREPCRRNGCMMYRR